MKGVFTRSNFLFVIIIVKITALVLFFQNCKRFSNFTVSTDFEPLETVYLVWNDEDSILLVDMISHISRHESVTLFIRDDENIQDKISQKINKANGDLTTITFVPKRMLTKNNWIRDFAPLFIKESERLGMIQFPYWDESNDLAEFISGRDTIQLKKSKWKTLGGTRELNGRGTGIFVEEHEKFMAREEGFNKKRHEEKLKREFNLEKVIWLKQGIPQDELPIYGPIDENVYPTGSCNHIDEFCRFIAPDKIMISYVTEKEATNEILREARRRLDENYRILKNATDQNGKPFEIIRMPFAPVVLKPFYSTYNPYDYTTEVTSYMNFLLTNKTVIVPTYKNADTTLLTRAKEEFIVKTFAQHLPEKEVIFFDVGSLNSRGGGIHCISASKPLSTKKKAAGFKLRFRKKSKT